jgi:hypothetical protein
MAVFYMPSGSGDDDVTNASKAKGDSAELEVQAILRDLLGYPARRMLGAGRRDDVGDITGIPNVTIQVVNWPSDYLAAVRHKPLGCEEQRERAGTTFAATFVRLRGGVYRVCLTPEQWATYVRETQ